jgi:hypothetical protein
MRSVEGVDPDVGQSPYKVSRGAVAVLGSGIGYDMSERSSGEISCDKSEIAAIASLLGSEVT